MKHIYFFDRVFTFLSKWHLAAILSRNTKYGCDDSDVVIGTFAKRRSFGDNKIRFWKRPNALLVAQYKLKHCKKYISYYIIYSYYGPYAQLNSCKKVFLKLTDGTDIAMGIIPIVATLKKLVKYLCHFVNSFTLFTQVIYRL